MDTFKKAKSGRGFFSLVSVQKHLERSILCTFNGLRQKDNTKSISLFLTRAWPGWKSPLVMEITSLKCLLVLPHLWLAGTCSLKCRHSLEWWANFFKDAGRVGKDLMAPGALKLALCCEGLLRWGLTSGWSFLLPVFTRVFMQETLTPWSQLCQISYNEWPFPGFYFY